MVLVRRPQSGLTRVSVLRRLKEQAWKDGEGGLLISSTRQREAAEGVEQGRGELSLLPEHAPSEGPRSTAAVRSPHALAYLSIELEKRVRMVARKGTSQVPFPEAGIAGLEGLFIAD